MSVSVIDAVLNLLQDDPHQWSERSCPTCRAIGSLAGRPFGCYVLQQNIARYAQKRSRDRAEALVAKPGRTVNHGDRTKVEASCLRDSKA